ncbi:MAG TPA: gfo/Idh/MocA family oxidoreductase, partial [Segetibacter sp.]
MKKNLPRRQFIRSASVAGIGVALLESFPNLYGRNIIQNEGRVGIIGLDTSHSVAFTKSLNTPEGSPQFKGYHVVAAYPKGSNDIESS